MRSSLPNWLCATADAAPTRQAVEVLDELSARVDRELERWRALRDGEVAAFSAMIRRLDIPAVWPPAKT